MVAAAAAAAVIVTIAVIILIISMMLIAPHLKAPPPSKIIRAGVIGVQFDAPVDMFLERCAANQLLAKTDIRRQCTRRDRKPVGERATRMVKCEYEHRSICGYACLPPLPPQSVGWHRADNGPERHFAMTAVNQRGKVNRDRREVGQG